MNENRGERKANSRKEMSAREWQFKDFGSAEPAVCSFEKIFAAYHDYRQSQQWG